MQIFEAMGRTAMLIFNVAMLPLSIYAIMNIMGWDWIKAGVGALILSAMPMIGSIGNLILAIAGIYFVVMNWHALF